MNDASMLVWAEASESVAAVERRARAVDLTLGPLLMWARNMDVRTLCQSRLALRFNPVLCRIEDAVSAFAYVKDGVHGRTSGTPREACGPELKQGLYGSLASVHEVQLRLLPKGAELWLKVSARDTAEIHTYVRTLARASLGARALWTELASAWLCYCGAMAPAMLRLAHARALSRGLEAEASEAPVGPSLAQGFIPAIKTWESLGPRDSLVLSDPWAVLAW